MCKSLLFLGICLCCAIVPLQAQDLANIANVDLFQDFGSIPDLLFLKGMAPRIEQAWQVRNALALSAYAGMLFYAERISGYQHPLVSGRQLLEAATRIVKSKRRRKRKELEMIAGVWKDAYFGPGEKSKARQLMELSTKMILTLSPGWREVHAGENIYFTAFLKRGSQKVLVSTYDLAFSAKYGTFQGNVYTAPNVTEKTFDSIVATHQNGLKGFALIIVLPSSNVQANSRKKLNPLQTFRNKVAKVLMASEAAKVKAQEKLSNKIQAFLQKLPASFDTLKYHLSLRRESFWSGFKTSEAYHYEDSLNIIRVEAHTTAKWVCESIRRALQRNGIRVERALLERLRTQLPKIFRAEGTATLN